MPQYYAVVVAGGSGVRMGALVPKQFLEITGRPVIMHTLEAFQQFNQAIHLTLVLPSAHIGTWHELCRKHDFKVVHHVVAGGASRFQSVRNGLNSLDGDGLVAVHDGVRPLVSQAVIAESFRSAAEEGSGVASLPLKESIREIDRQSGGSVARDRSVFRVIQTPQTFRLDWLKQAYLQDEVPQFTDDASVVESAGFRITLIDGNEENIKITHPMDILVAEALLGDKKSPN